MTYMYLKVKDIYYNLTNMKFKTLLENVAILCF